MRDFRPVTLTKPTNHILALAMVNDHRERQANLKSLKSLENDNKVRVVSASITALSSYILYYIV